MSTLNSNNPERLFIELLGQAAATSQMTTEERLILAIASGWNRTLQNRLQRFLTPKEFRTVTSRAEKLIEKFQRIARKV